MINYCLLRSFIDENPQQLDGIKQSYITLLRELTTCPDVTLEQFISSIDKMPDVFIAHDNNNIVATGTILIEQKIIHGCKSVGHIEDIVVKKEYRNRGIAKELLNILKNHAKSKNCYKIILDCNDANVIVYEKSGFAKTGNCMSIYL